MTTKPTEKPDKPQPLAPPRVERTGLHGAWRFGIVRTCAALVFLAFASPLALGALPLDAAGWSILTPSPDSRLIYVSATGNDTSATVYQPSDPAIGPDPFHPVGPIQPFATYSAAFAKARNYTPDWILMERGDTWTGDTFTHLAHSGVYNGRSDSERFVLTSYGSSPVRPTFQTGTAAGIRMSGGGGRTQVKHIAIVGVHFYDQTRDPASPDYTGFVAGGEGLGAISSASIPMDNVLIEDCQVEYYATGLDIWAIDANSGFHVDVRRNVINNNNSGQGMITGQMQYVTVVENVFDHNGWQIQGNGGSDGSGGKAWMLNHNTYFQNAAHFTMRGNMFLRASSIGNKWSANTGVHSAHDNTLDNNLYVEGELMTSIGGNVAGPYRFANFTVTNNVAEAIGRTQPTGRTLSWGIDMQDWDGGIVQNNLFIRQDNPAVTVTFAIEVGDKSVSMRNVQIDNNKVYGLLSTGALIRMENHNLYAGVSLTNNTVDTGNYLSPVAALTSTTFANYTLANNRYYSKVGAGAWFQMNGVNKNFAQWEALTGETGGTTGTLPYADPTRTVETYNATQGGPGTFDDFIAQAKLQSKAYWRTAYTAAAVNDYIRAGFSTNRPPAFHANPFSKPRATVGMPYSGTIASDASDPDTSDTLTFAKRSGPTWLSVATSGTLSGTPLRTDAGLSSFTVRVTDSGGLSDDATLDIPVVAVPVPPAAPSLSLY